MANSNDDSGDTETPIDTKTLTTGTVQPRMSLAMFNVTIVGCYSAILYVICFLAFSYAASYHLMIFGSGMVIGCIGLAAVWSVLYDGSYWRNTLIAILGLAGVSAGGMLGIYCGMASSRFGAIDNFLLQLVPPCMVTFTAMQFPLWIGRTAFGWCLSESKQPKTSTMSITDIAAFTALMAVSISVLRLTPARDEFSSYQSQIINVVLSGVFMSIVSIPVFLFLFGKDNRTVNDKDVPVGGGELPAGCMSSIFYLASISFGLILIFTFVSGGFPTIMVPVLGTLLASHLVFFGIPLALMRDRGFQFFNKKSLQANG